MSSYVTVFVKPDCEKCINAIDMVMEYGGIDEIVVVGKKDNDTTKAFGEKMAEYADGVTYISEEENGEDALPQVYFDSFSVSYDELLEAYEIEELDGYFT
ncbi:MULTISPECIES: hypothetical protein [unclassified Moraxella]|uniref:hypothetical protein n=1 Tax=unclassified Moraxella TaxID=2685852 RepID=UPI003AF73BB7